MIPGQTASRLSVTDNSFLVNEKGGAHMHVGGALVFEGPALDFDVVRGRIASRMDRVPRYRQKLVAPPMQLGRPMWVDDSDFNIEYHVRHTALPAPGDEAQLEALVGRLFSQRLDRDKPLWEMWYVTGLNGGRFALINKVHHALVDGVSGVDVVTLLLDAAQAGSGEPLPPEARAWNPRVEPSPAQLAAGGVREIVGGIAAVARTVVGRLRSPRRAVA